MFLLGNMDGAEGPSEADKPSTAESEAAKSSDELFNDFYSEVS